jgi:hypothetical protein
MRAIRILQTFDASSYMFSYVEWPSVDTEANMPNLYQQK